ncbi:MULTISPECIES: hypothetical protein [Nocardiopsis]|uniref:Uncharacterized protein n=1 Tax=Nocardiopsis sinuspersici TaxID=501010 RepID=A0A1V3C246_9ACTN|nr:MULTISPECIES: hypothetical protein [Nocardiopsis]OOC54795.1 hypothetical protein NOSIN_14075 [Nocardiopsis sinuspersici]
MSTSPEDKNPADRSSPADESAAAPSTDTATEASSPDTGAGDAFLAGTPMGTAPATGGLFSAETFSVIGLMLFALVALNTRLLQLFGWFFVGGIPTVRNQGEISMYTGEVTAAGGLSALAVLAGAVALFRGNAATRAWARWAAAATVITGALLLLVSALVFVSLPGAP